MNGCLKSGKTLRRALRALLMLTIPVLLAGRGDAQEQEAAADSASNPAGIVLGRSHEESFIGGEEVLVTVTISASSEEPLFALGLYETAPAGWTFEGLEVQGGPQPDILPAVGMTGVLEFGWVSPQVPVQLRYALRVPPQEQGARFISGQVEYRLESDPRRNSAPVLTGLNGEANEAPTISLLGGARIIWSINETFEDPGATAQDKEDGDISEKVQSTGRVDVGVAGEYTLSYGVMDSVGNRSEAVFRVVVVRDDTEEPQENPGGGGGGLVGGNAPPGRQPGKAMAAASSTPGDRPGQDISMVTPELALGGNRPTHVLPRGGGASSSGASSDTAVEDAPVSSRLSDNEAPLLVAGRVEGGAGATGGATDIGAQGTTILPGWAIAPALIVVILASGVVALLGWRGVFLPSRRRRG